MPPRVRGELGNPSVNVPGAVRTWSWLMTNVGSRHCTGATRSLVSHGDRGLRQERSLRADPARRASAEHHRCRRDATLHRERRPGGAGLASEEAIAGVQERDVTADAARAIPVPSGAAPVAAAVLLAKLSVGP
jgi:hypothetical protein